MYLLDYHIIRHSVTDWKSREMEERAKAPYLNILYQLVPNRRDSSSTFDARCMSIFQGLHLHHRQNTSQHSARLPGAKVSNQTFRGTCSNCWWASVDAKLTASKLTDMLQKVLLLSPLYMKAHHSSSHNYRFRPSSSRAVAMQWPRTAEIIGAYAQFGPGETDAKYYQYKKSQVQKVRDTNIPTVDKTQVSENIRGLATFCRTWICPQCPVTGLFN